MEQTLERAAYVSEEWFQRERERVFSRQWFCVGREEELPAPGDHLVCDILGESILITRGRDGGLSAYANVCRHRGTRLTDRHGKPEQEQIGPSGTFHGAIQCPYHNWTYSFDGRLRAAPFFEEEDDLRKEDLPLHHVGLETWGGFIWCHLDPDHAQPLSSQFQGATDYLANYPLGDLKPVVRIVYPVAANWKAIVENYNECYHCGPVHPELVELVPEFRQGGGSDLDWDAGIPHREGAWTFTAYPNLMLSLSADHVAAFTLWPSGPAGTTIVCDFLFHEDEIEKPGFDPDDAVSFWDVINRQDWKICEEVQAGMSSRYFTRGYYAPMEDYSMDIRRYLDDLM
jgi:Rieske 2Fe-2S family protein